MTWIRGVKHLLSSDDGGTLKSTQLRPFFFLQKNISHSNRILSLFEAASSSASNKIKYSHLPPSREREREKVPDREKNKQEEYYMAGMARGDSEEQGSSTFLALLDPIETPKIFG